MSLLRRVIERAGQFIFNLRNGTYQQDSKVLSNADLLSVLENRIADARSAHRGATTLLLAGQIDVATWREAVAVELRRATWQSFALGRGGWEQISSADRTRMTELLSKQYGYLNDFSRAIQDGELSEAEIKARMDMYAGSIQSAFYEGQRDAKEAAGMTRERRVLNPAEHCGDCEDFAAEGWQELGYFPPPGEGSQCMSNCKCDMEFA